MMCGYVFVTVDVGILSTENMSQVLYNCGNWCLVLDGIPV